MTAQPTPTRAPGGDVELVVLERGKGERFAVLWREYEGFHFLDLRVQFQAEDGRWLPTKKGVTVKLRELHNVADAFARAVELAKEVRR
jgi:hypothetical protein